MRPDCTSSGGGPDQAGKVFVPKTPEVYDDPATTTVNEGHDADGNLLRDGRWVYTWDAENRLIQQETRADAPAGSKRRMQFEYDFMGRRIKRVVTNLDTSAVDEIRYLYDGWNLIAEWNSTLTVRPHPGGPVIALPTPGPIGGPYNYNTHPVWPNADVATMAQSSGVGAQAACRRLALAAFGQNQYFYSPTSIGRATGAAAVLWKKQNGGLPLNDPPGLNAAKVYGESVDRGHLIPYAYDGSGGLENVVAQERGFNRGTFRTTINGGLDAALTGGRGGGCKYVCILVAPVYAGVRATGVMDPGKPVPRAFAIAIITPDGVSGASLIQPTLMGNLLNDISPWNAWNTGNIPLD